MQELSLETLRRTVFEEFDLFRKQLVNLPRVSSHEVENILRSGPAVLAIIEWLLLIHSIDELVPDVENLVTLVDDVSRGRSQPCLHLLQLLRDMIERKA
jgi:hypothetical protein